MNQNKGIGAYKDRPGYFLGGMVGGAILGALVNKIQGNDWKRGALMGGLGGGLMGGLTGGGGLLGGTGASKWAAGIKNPWFRKLAMSATNSPQAAKIASGALGGGLAYMMGDPAEEKRRQEEAIENMRAMQRSRNKEMYGDWYVDPWVGWKKGGAINARPGYPGGGSATLEYTDPDLYTPTGEGGGPSSRPILQIPLGPEGSFADEFDDLDMASASDPMDEWNQMYENYLLEGGDPMPLPDFIEMMTSEGDFTPDYGAQGGYKKKAKGGIEDLDLTQGGSSFGPGTGTSDDIPAMLSDGEFVVTANAVKNLGGGDRMTGARRMYQMMNQLDPNSQTPAEMSTVGIA